MSEPSDTHDATPVTRAELEPIPGDRQDPYLKSRKRDYGRWRVDDYLFDVLLHVANRPRLLVTATIGVLVGTGLVYSLIEPEKGPIEGIWWSIVTGFTVGYGDQYPVTTAGRGVGAFLIVSMFILALCLGAQITSRLIEDADEFTHEEQEQIKALLGDDARDRALMLTMLADLSGRLATAHVAADHPAAPAAGTPCEACGHVPRAKAPPPTPDAADPAAPTERPTP